MNKEFIHDDFLLTNSTAKKLYHEHAKQLPVIDYHCHLPPDEIASDRKFENITQVWLYGDHYKWRAMRANGVPEQFVTGSASDYEKFLAWAHTVPHTLRNPLYHWTHMELKKNFGISDRLFSPSTAESIWVECNEKLAGKGFTTQGLITASNVKVVCTTDDPVDSLEHHIAIASKPFGTKILPTFRPDKGMAADNPDVFYPWMDKLKAVSDTDIKDYDSYLSALRKRHDFFHQQGCRLSDHGLENPYAADFTQKEVEAIFQKLLQRKPVTHEEVLKFKSAMMYEFGIMDAEKNWVQQLHLGALRNNNQKMFKALGPDTGYDSIGDFEMAKPLSKYLSRLAETDRLAKTILYNLNPRDNEVFATMIANFQDGTVPGKMQFGSGWWFLDQLDGMKKQMNALSLQGLLSRFVGMLTDSRSFLSYSRHDYFRRLLCDIIGSEVETGLIPEDDTLYIPMIENICYYNALNYFDFGLPGSNAGAQAGFNGVKKTEN